MGNKWENAMDTRELAILILNDILTPGEAEAAVDALIAEGLIIANSSGDV